MATVVDVGVMLPAVIVSTLNRYQTCQGLTPARNVNAHRRAVPWCEVEPQRMTVLIAVGVLRRKLDMRGCSSSVIRYVAQAHFPASLPRRKIKA